MQRSHLQEIARSVKENRIKKRYTQQDLAQISGISLRSIQRIENAEVIPRPYTLHTLAEHLGFTLEEEPQVLSKSPKQLNNAQKAILSCGIAVLLFLLASAYIFQSPRFPETEFEFVLYLAGFVGIYTLVVVAIWK